MARAPHLSVAADNPEAAPRTPWGTIILTAVVMSAVTTATGLTVTWIASRPQRVREKQKLAQDQQATHWLVGRELEREQEKKAVVAPAPAPSSTMADLPHPMSGLYESNTLLWREQYERGLAEQRDALLRQQREIEEQRKRMSEGQRKLDARLREFEKRLDVVEEANPDEEEDEEEEEEEEDEEEEKPKRRRR